jgi:hypothetical protein
MPKILFDLSGGWTKELADSSQKLYRSKLNALAEEGFDTPQKLWSKPGRAVKAIKKISGDGTAETDNHKRRQILSAIFAVFSEEQRKSNNAFYRYYQKCLPKKDGATEKAWVPRKDYVSDSGSEDNSTPTM